MVGPRWRVRSQCRHSFANAPAEYKRTRCATRRATHKAPPRVGPSLSMEKNAIKNFPGNMGHRLSSRPFFFSFFFAHFDPSIPACRKGSSVRFGGGVRTHIVHRLQSVLYAYTIVFRFFGDDATESRDFVEAAEKATTRLLNPMATRVLGKFLSSRIRPLPSTICCVITRHGV